VKRILIVSSALALVLLSTVCKKPLVGSPPATPSAPAGISNGGYNTSYEFTAFTTDPDTDSVAIRFSWGDGATSDWSGWVASGETVAQAHSWPSAGSYQVKAQAKDNTGSSSNWSAALAVTITTNRPPNTPAIPSGPSTAPKDSGCFFTSITTDPDGDGVSYRFSWGNGDTSEWGGWTQSGAPGGAMYAYPSAGTFQVRAQARDANEARSGWSNPLSVTITGGPPLSLQLSAATDSTITLSWTAPTQGTPTGYNVYFKDVAGTAFVPVDTVTATLVDIDPHGATGLYTVSAVFGAVEYFCADTLSTIPVYTAQTTVCELNAAGNAGYGWERPAGTGATYSMATAGNAAYVDFYITDFGVGYAGPYAIASPDMGPSDPGNVVPTGPWRVSAFSNALTSETAQLPTYSTSTYFTYTDLTIDPCLVGCYTTADSHYALVKLTNYNVGAGTVSVESWFQLVKGLRLIKH